VRKAKPLRVCFQNFKRGPASEPASAQAVPGGFRDAPLRIDSSDADGNR
jgi:hypothetical protein